MNAKQMIPLCFLACCTFAVAPAIAQTITHVPAFTFRGETMFDSFGSAVSGAGDVNNDGFDDVIVGARGGDNNELAPLNDNSGFARVISGSDGSLLYQFNGNAAGDNFGRSVSGAGDVNGDGFDDLIVGAPLDDSNGDLSGSARVLSGSDGSVLYNFEGDSEGDNFGFSVSEAGDVNGDGFADVIVGNGRNDNGSNDIGIARVFSGFDGSVLHNFDSADGGLRVSSAGDVNGDGFDDLIVGNSNDDTNGILSGSAQVFSGSDGSLLYNFLGDSVGDRFGSSVSGAGDVNGDGLADLIVSAPRSRNPAIVDNFETGSARVFSGADGSVLYNFDGSVRGDFFGRSASGAGDVNGDGFADLIVGAEVNNSNFGFGAVRVISGINGDVLYNFIGDSPFDRFGSSVSGAGDVNGDGLADFIAGNFLFGFGNPGDGQGTGYARLFVSQITAPILGDFDHDGDVDADDVDFYSGQLEQAATGELEQIDLNGDGQVTLADHDLHITTLVQTSNGQAGTSVGDANLDGVVDVLGDGFVLVSNLGATSGVGFASGDLNADGLVNVMGDGFRLVTNLGANNNP